MLNFTEKELGEAMFPEGGGVDIEKSIRINLLRAIADISRTNMRIVGDETVGLFGGETLIYSEDLIQLMTEVRQASLEAISKEKEAFVVQHGRYSQEEFRAHLLSNPELTTLVETFENKQGLLVPGLNLGQEDIFMHIPVSDSEFEEIVKIWPDNEIALEELDFSKPLQTQVSVL